MAPTASSTESASRTRVLPSAAVTSTSGLPWLPCAPGTSRPVPGTRVTPTARSEAMTSPDWAWASVFTRALTTPRSTPTCSPGATPA